MEDSKCLSDPHNAALVIVAFLQADCRISETKSEYYDELVSLEKRIRFPWDGDLETDGHTPSRIPESLHDIGPFELWPAGGHAEVVALEVAEELRLIAAQFQHDITARATRNLRRNILQSTSDQFKYHLVHEVNSVMKQLVGLDQLPQERLLVALALTLVKGVCEQTPRLLGNLFDVALEFICHSGGR